MKRTKRIYHPLDKGSRVRISYFSGTGCTELVAKTIKEYVSRITDKVEIYPINLREKIAVIDFLFLCFPVHASNAPKPVMEWTKSLGVNNPIRTIVISVSGGGDITPNLACRVPLIRILKSKGHEVIYEEMIVMPSNWIVPTSEAIASTLLKVLPQKVERIVRRLLSGEIKRVSPGPLNRLLTLLGRLESLGARRFGKNIHVLESCVACAICEQKCPVGNIRMDSNKPCFGSNCAMCLSCIYRCPVGALEPRKLKFVLIKNGFSLDSIQSVEPIYGQNEIKECTKGLLWLGVRRYLLDRNEQ